MPNWCSNTLTLEGKGAADVARSLAGEDTVFDFNKVVPMPELIKHNASGFRKFDDGTEHKVWYQAEGDDGGKSARPLTEEEQEELKRIGYPSWYEWSIANWGTKWNASEGTMDITDEEYVDLEFDTAWGPPTAVVEALSEKYPKLYITHFYDEPGCEILGRNHYGEAA